MDLNTESHAAPSYRPQEHLQPMDRAASGHEPSFATMALDALGTGVVVASTSCEVLYHNQAASHLLRPDHPLTLANGRLRARTKIHHDRLVTLVYGACCELRQSGAMLLPAGSAGNYHVVRVEPLPASGRGPRAAMLLLAGAPVCAMPLPLLEQLFGLRKSEAEVADLIAAGLTTKEIAVARNVSITTVKSQIREIFAKTGVSRQTELMRLLAAVPTVLGDR